MTRDVSAAIERSQSDEFYAPNRKPLPARRPTPTEHVWSIRQDWHQYDGELALAEAEWPKCSHPWHFNYKPRGGQAWRFSLDAEIGHHIESKTEAEKLAGDIRAAINAGTYVRMAERRKAGLVAATDTLTLEQLGANLLRHVTRIARRGSRSRKTSGIGGT
jgi:hypothetical protein